jgi:repressor LexA
MGEELTERQRNVLSFIYDCIQKRGAPPTVREIAARFGLASPRTISDHLDALQAKGFIRRRPHLSRGIELVEEQVEKLFYRSVGIPVLGTVPAGRPLVAYSDIEEVLTTKTILPEGFSLRIQGDSMSPELKHGDYALVLPQRAAQDGQIVVALINGDEHTVKRYRERRGKVILEPVNPAYEPVEVDPEEVRIAGIVVGLYRRLR